MQYTFILIFFLFFHPPKSPTYADMVGCWQNEQYGNFIHIRFFANRRFEFLDYNINRDKQEVLRGRITLQGTRLYFNYDDSPRQSFELRYYDGTWHVLGANRFYNFTKGRC